ncbi:hydroxyethylthiazole kinase [Sphingobacterium sp. N143]|uniref:hydroxyethylthiazole kinase n=1 Tax=Sphingobacterium sp. N143 TaxID=2746727 RepID=UPI002577F2C6|nr:hydroxyethylthiazole kinase [Sphingobacterium sp. N143]MDM1292797.1 hydroxyethylthiazole kinase [Sphingobacterium sp. N143]
MEDSIIKLLKQVRQQKPLVHNITNMVVMNNTANALLALGASPVMVHSPSEVREVVDLAQALVLNIGTLSELTAESMLIAAEHANNIGRSWVLDPVGAGISAFRNDLLVNLLTLRPTVIRGNASEIMTLYNFNQVNTKGVDSTTDSRDALAFGKALQEQTGAIVCISGEIDYILSEQHTVEVHNGHPLMTQVTGLGCSATALIGAFLGVTDRVFEASIAGVSILSLAGELAQQRSSGPGSLQVNLYDALYQMDDEIIRTHLKIKHYAH